MVYSNNEYIQSRECLEVGFWQGFSISNFVYNKSVLRIRLSRI